MAHRTRRPLVAAALLGTLALAAPQTVLADPGDADTSFGGGDGLATLDVSGVNGSDAAYAVVIHDGKIIVAGQARVSGGQDDFLIARFESNGDPDPSFGGGDGYVTADYLGDDQIDNALTVLPDGKILVAGYTTADSDQYSVVLARFEADGDPDPTFGGGDGSVMRDFGFAFGAVAYDLLLLPNGRIVVAGAAYQTDDSSLIAVMRFKANGGLDLTFGGGDGITTREHGPKFDEIWRLLLMPDGDILAGGWASVGDAFGDDVMLTRFNPNGSIDKTFGLDGTVTYNPTNDTSDYVAGMALQGNRIVLVSPGEGDVSGDDDVVLMRLKATGAPDRTFGGGDGEIVRDFGTFERADDVVVQGDGKILVAGQHDNDLFVARFLANGTIDTGFGTGGFNTIADAQGDTVTLQPNGRIVVGGSTNAGDVAVARFRP